jgi:hypothetical protein
VSGFNNPIIGGGGSLVYPSIHSPNFNVANPAGSPTPSWGILKSGLAFFFGLALAGGTITGPNYIFNTQGLFFYSGAPALGNLIISLVGPGVVLDPKGNVVTPNGLAVYSSAGSDIFMGLSGTSAFLKFPSGSANEASAGQIDSALILAGAAQFIGTALTSAALNIVGHRDVVNIQANSPNAGGTSFANMGMNYFDDAGNQTQVAFYDATGFNVSKGPGSVLTDVTQRNATTNAVTQITPSYTIPAGIMVPGTSWDLELFFAGNQNATTATTLEFFFQVNGNNTAITLPAAFVTANGAFRGSARLIVACKIPGPANTASIFINGEVNVTQTTFAVANSTKWSVSSPNAQGPNASVDTSIAQLCAISTQWGTSGSLGGLWSRFRRRS